MDSRLTGRFLSFRLNVPSGDESQVLLTVTDWQTVAARSVPEREGRPIVGVDLGGGRAWSAAALHLKSMLNQKSVVHRGLKETKPSPSSRGLGR